MTDPEIPRKPPEITWINLVTVFKVAISILAFLKQLKRSL